MITRILDDRLNLINKRSFIYLFNLSLLGLLTTDCTQFKVALLLHQAAILEPLTSKLKTNYSIPMTWIVLNLFPRQFRILILLSTYISELFTPLINVSKAVASCRYSNPKGSKIYTKSEENFGRNNFFDYLLYRGEQNK